MNKERVIEMKTSDFYYDLPEELIAQFPSRFRDEAKMLVLHAKTGRIEHKMVSDFAEYFGEGDILVANDTKVFPARLYAKKEKTNANIEVFLLRELHHENRYWDVLVDPARKIRIGNKLYFGDDIVIDDYIDIEWARIPHFYRCFYVYKYATGISAALALAKRVVSGGTKERDEYFMFLKSGGSRYPIESLKVAGVDMESPEPVQAALDEFAKMVDELENILK